MEVVAALRFDELVGCRRALGGVPTEAVVRHGESPDLGDDVLAASDVVDVGLPLLEDLLALRLVRPDTERCAEVVEHHRRRRHRTGEIEEVAVLVVVVPRVVGEATFAEPGNTGPKRWVGVQPDGRPAGNGQHLGVQRMRTGVANAPEPPVACRVVGIEHGVEGRCVT